MKKALSIYIIITFLISFQLFGQGTTNLILGADQSSLYLPILKDKKVALVVNQTSVLSNNVHLLDELISKNINVTKVFAPEHGFRGDAGAGESIYNGKDIKTGLPIISLYGKNKRPTPEMLKDVDVVIFDIQDVGARFYTYISTMYYVMDACADNNKEIVILDRPNPHDFIDGPVLDIKYRSFVGMLPIPILHGTTVGELAQMINEEGWLTNSQKVKLIVVPIRGWKHGQPYSLPIKPSPNLPNDQSIKLYSSLCFFEATNVSVGRGTYFPFQMIGYPDPRFGDFTFTPKSLPGFDKDPLQKDKICYGLDLRNEELSSGFNLNYLITFYKKSKLGSKFFKSPQFMNLLSGSNTLQNQIIQDVDENIIRKSWQAELDTYKKKRKKYLLYTDKTY